MPSEPPAGAPAPHDRAAAPGADAARLALAAAVLDAGPARYIWRFAFLRVWLPLTAVASIILSLFVPPPAAILVRPSVLAWLGLLLPGAVLASVVFGRMMWRNFEQHWRGAVEAVPRDDGLRS